MAKIYGGTTTTPINPDMFGGGGGSMPTDAIRFWQPETEYKVGDYVYSDAIGYMGALIYVICKCTEAHTSKNSVYADGKWNIMDIYASYSISDINGNPIHETYATKEELAEAIGEALEGDY